MRKLILTVLILLCCSCACADEIVITLGGDCVLGTRECWKNQPKTFDTMIGHKGFDWCFQRIREPFETDDISLINL